MTMRLPLAVLSLAMAGLGGGGALAQSDSSATPVAATPMAAAGESLGRIVPVETDAEGHGATRDVAISNALANAVAQETGVSVEQAAKSVDTTTQGTLDVAARLKTQNSEQQQAAAVVALGATGGAAGGQGEASGQGSAAHGPATYASTGANRGGGNAAVTPVEVVKAGQMGEASAQSKNERLQGVSNETQHQAVSATLTGSSGKVARYSVISVDPAKDGGFDARVHAVLEITRREGGTADSRRRITVAPFTGPIAAGQLRDRLVMDLTQSRRFAVLDRSNDADYWHEMQTIAESGSTADEARIAKVAGADYILSGKLFVTTAKTTGHGALTTYESQDLTGEVVAHTTASTLHTTAGSAAADFELIEVATRQIVMADHLQVTGANMDAVAARISGDIVEAIYPPRLVSISDPNALVVNEGGNGMQRGKRLRLMQMGEEMFDPYTHESLGRTEREVGTIEVTEVQQRLSYAKLVGGQLPSSADAAVLRPVAAPAPVAAAKTATAKPAAVHKKAKAAATSEAESDGGGVKLPFDK